MIVAKRSPFSAFPSAQNGAEKNKKSWNFFKNKIKD
jgi:hypothetical protein